ncbi:MAG: ATP-binding protein [Nanoarchaeota archaeon]
MYIKRVLEEKIRKYLSAREIIAVVGPRQSGKTTLLKHIFDELKNAVFLDFEDRSTLELFDQDIKSFIELYVKKYEYVFIDEFQYAKEGGKNLKYIYDNYKTKIIISGSSASGPAINSLKYLVGRIFVFTLYPFSFEEYLSFKDKDIYALYLKNIFTLQVTERIYPYFEEYCIFGGYPRVVVTSDKEEKQIVLKNIYSTYFLKEIKEILNLPEDYKLSRLIHALSLQISNLVNYKEISGISGFNYPDLMEYLNILEKTFIIIRSLPYYTNKRTELVKAPKVFFLDIGFRNIVLNNFQLLSNRQDKGALYENFIASELIKKDIQVKFWRTKSKAEVDFIIEHQGEIIPLEVKSTLNETSTSKSFQSFIGKYKPKKGYMLSERFSSKKENIDFMPIFAISRLFDS